MVTKICLAFILALLLCNSLCGLQTINGARYAESSHVRNVDFEKIRLLCWKAGFRARFGIRGFGTDHFITLPVTRSEATNQSWTPEKRPDAEIFPSLELYCHPSFIVCVLYDDIDYTAGIQIALPEKEFKNAIWDWNTQGYLKWKPRNGKNYWTKQQYYVNEAYLSISEPKRKANRDPSSLLQAGGSVWVSGIRGELFEITKNPAHLLANGFSEQGCIPGMGHHFWRLKGNTTECNDETFPWFSLNDRARNLVGTGLFIPGQITKDLPKDWFERPPELAIRAMVPRGPKCLYYLAAKPGFTTIHIFYVSEPWKTFCWV